MNRPLRLLISAALPAAVTLAFLIAVTLIALLAIGREFLSTLQFVAVMWLAINQVPIVADGITLGALPLLPTIIYGAAVGWQARTLLVADAVAARNSLNHAEPGLPTEEMQRAMRGAAIAGLGLTAFPVIVTALALTVISAAPPEFPARCDSVGTALLWTIAVNALACLAGQWALHRSWLRYRIPSVVLAGIRIAAAYCAALIAIAGVMILVSLAFHWSEMSMLFATAEGDVWGSVALALLSIAYLPNLLIFGGSVAVGGQAHLGNASASVFSAAVDHLPALPIMAAWPAETPHWSVQAFLIAAVIAAVLVARFTARWFSTWKEGVYACLIGAGVATVFIVVAGLFAGGQVGVLGTAGLAPLLTAGLVAAWIGLVGSATMALSLVGVAKRRTAHEERVRQRRERLAAQAAASQPAHGAGAAALEDPSAEPTESSIEDDDPDVIGHNHDHDGAPNTADSADEAGLTAITFDDAETVDASDNHQTPSQDDAASAASPTDIDTAEQPRDDADPGFLTEGETEITDELPAIDTDASDADTTTNTPAETTSETDTASDAEKN